MGFVTKDDLTSIFTSLNTKLRKKPTAVQITQAEYDALTSEEKHDTTKAYYITDGEGGGGGSELSITDIIEWTFTISASATDYTRYFDSSVECGQVLYYEIEDPYLSIARLENYIKTSCHYPDFEIKYGKRPGVAEYNAYYLSNVIIDSIDFGVEYQESRFAPCVCSISLNKHQIANYGTDSAYLEFDQFRGLPTNTYLDLFDGSTSTKSLKIQYYTLRFRLIL